MSKKVASKGALKPLAVAASALSVVAAQQVHADAVLYPYVVVSPTVTTLISTIYSNKGAVESPSLHYRAFYKPTNPDSLSEKCQETNVFRPTSPNDIVTFDIGGMFGSTSDAPGVLFGDGANNPGKNANYGTASFDFINPAFLGGIPATRGFMVVNTEDPNDTISGQVYGEALVLEVANGAAWGYRAYNSAQGATGPGIPIDFSNAQEVQGDVLLEGELAPIEIYPLQEWTQKLVVTPIAGGLPGPGGLPMIDQAPSDPTSVGTLTVNLELRGKRVPPYGTVQDADNPANATNVFDRDENPISGVIPTTITCVGAPTINSLLSPSTQNQIANGGWAYVNTYIPGHAPGDPVIPATFYPMGTTNQAVVQKVTYNNGGTLSGEALLNGVVNSGLWLRDGTCTTFNSVNGPVDVSPGAACVPIVGANHGVGEDHF